MREKNFLFALNGGAVSPLALGRVDLTRMRISAEEMVNMLPRVIGPVAARPGLRYLSSTYGNNTARNLPFVFSAEDTALIELSNLMMRVRVDGELIERAAVATVVTNGDFSSGTGWTLTTTGGGTATIATGVLTLATPVRGGSTLAKRSDAVALADQNIVHAIDIDVTVGPIKFRCGSTDGGAEYISETELESGFHSIAFIPTGATFYVQFSCESEASRIVNSCVIAPAGELQITTPWSSADLFKLRYDQSGDVIFVTSSAGTYQPMRIERRGTQSWSLTKCDFIDGPLRGKTSDVTLTPSARTGNGTLTASAPFFDAGHVGAIFRLSHNRTVCVSSLAAGDQFTDQIRVSGNSKYDIDSDGTDEKTKERDIILTVTGVWVGTLSYLVSDDDGVSWQRVDETTANVAAIEVTPGTNNTVVQARFGFLSGDYTSGTAVVTASYRGGGGEGYVRITAVGSTTSASYEVVGRLHDVTATKDWSEGQFSTTRGWPTAVGLFEGRLWWGSDDKISGSVSDAFKSFDLDTEGDSGPIIRSIATGPVNRVQWILGLARLCIGTSGAEPVGRSSSFDEPMTPTNFSIKDVSTQGSADLQAVKIDRAGIFVQRSGKRVYSLGYSAEGQDYAASELTRFHPNVLDAGVKVVSVQRQPDTRIWFALNNGTAACLTWEPSEDVLSWTTFVTSGTIEDICVLPNTSDDDVYMVVRRTSGGVFKRYVERLAYDHEAQGGVSNYMADACIAVELSDELAAVTGLSHLEGRTVVVWANGAAIMNGDVPRTFVVSAGRITLPFEVSGTVIVGLSYSWRWKSAKLAIAAQGEAPLSRRKIIKDVAPILYKTHIRGIRYGQDFTTMDYLPLVNPATGADATANDVYETYDNQSQILPGSWSTDVRLCLAGQAPLPCTVLALSMTLEAN